MEHVSDIIESGQGEIAVKKGRKTHLLSAEGVAWRSLNQKVVIRKIEAHSAEHHLNRVREGRAKAVETSTLHLTRGAISSG